MLSQGSMCQCSQVMKVRSIDLYVIYIKNNKSLIKLMWDNANYVNFE